jgi:hypothetical protein
MAVRPDYAIRNTQYTIHKGLFISTLFIILLACRFGGAPPDPAAAVTPTTLPTPVPVSRPPGGQIVPSQEESQRAKQNFRQAWQEASNNRRFEFRVTDQEITSLVALEVKKEAQIPLAEPQIWFSGGKIYLSGKLSAGGPSPLPVLIVARPLINGNEQLIIQVDEAEMGNFKLPAAMVESLAQTINETLADPSLELQVESVEVLEGELVVIGRRVIP